ncbi:MAG: DegT/DnrJ/EryC1/StrS family aminotransferase [Bacteroidales bacterium]|jgi:dTDP-4-amino-4,6-dideoxygalactose transaminase|nr:DegT/DnrJ/EryC1/StrS family aminotransferase [Bacteroidales bacterium]MDD4214221.1 DegT/DnrJ/EryC1/StrS family aminotransferase [Bacteroidales bacterium]
MKVPYINLSLQHQAIKNEILAEITKLLDNGQFIIGDALALFEKSFSLLCGVKYTLGVANGTDALCLSLKALGIGPGDEVITAPNSFLASASSIALAGATPVFADVRDDFTINPDEIVKAITKKTKAILPVHLTGRPAEMNAIMDIAKMYSLFVVEDCAQAVGATYYNKSVGSFGDTGCFSLHPLKNLSACGDGGLITTNSDTIYNYLKKARNHGLKSRDECEFWSLNSRLDNIQAAILNVKLKKLFEWIERRRHIASVYREKLQGLDMIIPQESTNMNAVYHTFIIQTKHRDQLKDYLLQKEIDTKIHYPIPIHLQESASYLGYKKGDFPVAEKQAETILSLPVFPELTDEQINYVCSSIINFFNKEKK